MQQKSIVEMVEEINKLTKEIDSYSLNNAIEDIFIREILYVKNN